MRAGQGGLGRGVGVGDGTPEVSVSWSGAWSTGLHPGAALPPPVVQQDYVTDYTSILSPVSWALEGHPGTSVILTYSFAAAPAGYLGGEYDAAFLATFAAFTAAERDLARSALAQWADASGIIFLEDTSGLGDIQFGKYDLGLLGDPNVAGFAFYPDVSGTGQYAFGGDVFVDTGNDYTPDSDADTLLLLHEIGHALGLKHPFDPGLVLEPGLDTTDRTVMAYDGPRVTVLGPLDHDAVVHLYGSNADDGVGLPAYAWDAATATLSLTGTGTGDLIRGVFGRNVIAGLGGNDTLRGGAGRDRIEGGDGNDSIYGNGGADTLNGDFGDDHVAGAASAEQMNGGAGNDSLDSGGGADTMRGDDGDDLLTGNGQTQALNGGAGNDTLQGAGGRDTLAGGTGDDVYQYWFYGGKGVIVEAPGGGYDQVLANENFVLAAGAEVERITALNPLGALTPIDITGNDFGQLIEGNRYANRLDGLGGNDTIRSFGGGSTLYGADELRGGDGNDSLVGGDGIDRFDGGAGADT